MALVFLLTEAKRGAFKISILDRVEKLKEFLEQNPADSFVQHALALEYMKAGDDAAAQKLSGPKPGIIEAV